MADCPDCAEVVRRALAEDGASADITTALLGAAGSRAVVGRFIAERELVVAGGPVVVEVYRQLDPAVRVTQPFPEGTRAAPGSVVLEVTGPAAPILNGERVALNFLQRLSGVATATRAAVDAIEGTGARITHTRKTTPGLRALEVYAVAVGGGIPHRQSLAEAVLWKDNHWLLARRAGKTLAEALSEVPGGVPVIVEVETEDQLDQALRAGVRRLLLDNQPPERIAVWADRCGPDVVLEASGGIQPETAAAYARAGARVISLGALTHSSPAVPIRLEIATGGPGPG